MRCRMLELEAYRKDSWVEEYWWLKDWHSLFAVLAWL